MNNLGAICKVQHRPEEALAYLQQAVSIKADSFDVYNNLAAVYQQLNQFEQALMYYDQAILLEPGHASVRWNRSTVLLMLGRLKEGWEAFEWRRSAGHWQALPFPEWQGEALQDKTLLVLAEQGLGDEILFGSCLPELIKLSKHCIIECDTRLGDLYRTSFPEATIKAVVRQQRDWLKDLSSVDVCIPLGSISRFLRKNLTDFPNMSTSIHIKQFALFCGR
nr:tetratricopeptide repeat protein [uncultured Paraglaciecola sp.]